MYKLYLLRHAEAPSAFDLSDKDRPLSDHGIEQARLIANHLKDIDLVLCSSAKRTRMTFDSLIEGGVQFGAVEYLDELYNAPEDHLLNALKDKENKNILIIAHNPGIHALAVKLMGSGEPKDVEQLSLFYNPATLSVFECDIQTWSEIQPHQNKLIKLTIPD